jgi:hypothetical protein
MKLRKRDRRALLALGAAVVVIIVLDLSRTESQAVPVAATADSVATAEKRLARVRQLAAALPAREADLKAVTEQLADREKGLIRADTLAQAQAQLLQVARRVTAGQSPPIDLRNTELGQARPLGDDYGEISVPLTFECRIEQLLNLLADLMSQPELLAPSELRITTGNEKEKTINVRLVLSGVVPRKLVPEKRAPGTL